MSRDLKLKPYCDDIFRTGTDQQNPNCEANDDDNGCNDMFSKVPTWKLIL
jgi:hypothetical protein